jgi:hypothetical protein
MHSLDAPAETTSSNRILAAGFGAAYVPDGEREVGQAGTQAPTWPLPG